MSDPALYEAITAEGRLLNTAAKATGRTVGIEPATLLARDVALAPPGRFAPNRQCQLIQALDGWIAVSLARVEDNESVAAWLGEAPGEDIWRFVAARARARPCADLLDQALLLGMPVAQLGETKRVPPPNLGAFQGKRPGKRVVDLSALWAGPLCGGLLAEAGWNVTRVESLSRPDPTPQTAPQLDQRLNGRKTRVRLDLRDPSLIEAIVDADILITSGRAHALARLGLSPATVFDRNPGLLWVAITAHGFTGDGAFRVGFGDDCAAAGGLVRWGHDGPGFRGDALADPLTGLRAARLALEAQAQGKAGLLDVALAKVAADFAHV